MSIFPLRNANVVFFSYLVKEYRYWKEYKYGQYCTPLSQSDCRYHAQREVEKLIGYKIPGSGAAKNVE